MPEKSTFTFHHNFYPKSKIDFKGTKISEETLNRLQVLKQHYNDIASQHSSGIGFTYLEEMTIHKDPELPPVASKLYPLPLKDHKFGKEEIEHLLEAGLVKR